MVCHALLASANLHSNQTTACDSNASPNVVQSLAYQIQRSNMIGIKVNELHKCTRFVMRINSILCRLLATCPILALPSPPLPPPATKPPLPRPRLTHRICTEERDGKSVRRLDVLVHAGTFSIIFRIVFTNFLRFLGPGLGTRGVHQHIAEGQRNQLSFSQAYCTGTFRSLLTSLALVSQVLL